VQLYNVAKRLRLDFAINLLPIDVRKKLRNRVSKTYTRDLDRIDWAQTQAFMLGTGQVFINSRRRFDKGVVAEKNIGELKTELSGELQRLTDPSTDQKPIENVYYGEQLYSGPFCHEAPDLVVLAAEGYRISPNFHQHVISEVKSTRGEHSSPGIFLAFGDAIKSGFNLGAVNIFDVAPTILHTFGLPIPRDMDGRVLKELFKESSAPAKREIEYQEGDERARVKERIKGLKAFRKI
jgi:predicted AlkP superfamily phosphohydrolase/phosphomutase